MKTPERINKLTEKEKSILIEFKRDLISKYPDEIIKIIIFGSKARGDAHAESDIDVLVIIKPDNWQIIDAIRTIGYSLDESIDYKLSIQAFSEAHYNFLQENNFQFTTNVERDGILV